MIELSNYQDYFNDSSINLDYTFNQFVEGHLNEDTLIELLNTFSTKNVLEDYLDEILGKYWDPSLEESHFDSVVIEFLWNYLDLDD